MKKLVLAIILMVASCWFLRSHRLILEIREYNRVGGYAVLWELSAGHPENPYEADLPR